MEKTAVITGASRGIGTATAMHFRDNGFRVINLSRTDPAIKGVEHIACDLANIEAVQAMQQSLQACVGKPDQLVLVHNAGLLLKDNTADMSAQSFERALRVNVVGPSTLNTLLIPLMKAGSSILYVGSTLAEKAVANTCSYVVSKHAQLGLMRSTCQDLAGTGVHTVCVCPGFTATEMLAEHVGGNEEVLEFLAQGNALGRLVQPEEIAHTLLFAAQSPVLNGAIVHANLGQLET